MIASGAPAWAVWLALSVWTLATVIIVAVILYARATWKRIGPQVSPYLSMLGLGSDVGYIQSIEVGNGDVGEDDAA